MTALMPLGLRITGSEGGRREGGREGGREAGREEEREGEREEGNFELREQRKSTNSHTLEAGGRRECLMYVGGEEGLKTRPRLHLHTGTDVEMGVDEEGEAAQETASGTGNGKTSEGKHREGM